MYLYKAVAYSLISSSNSGH